MLKFLPLSFTFFASLATLFSSSPFIDGGQIYSVSKITMTVALLCTCHFCENPRVLKFDRYTLRETSFSRSKTTSYPKSDQNECEIDIMCLNGKRLTLETVFTG